MEALRLRLDGCDSVENYFILKVHTAIDAMAKSIALDTGGKKQEVINLPAAWTNPVISYSVWQLSNDLVFDGRAEFGLFGF